MIDHTAKVRIIFGLKIRQIRMERNLSLAEVAEKVGFSVSYLNEIEKGKKYPKAEKIMALASAFSVDYDALVSLKLINDLEPIADILNSSILTDLPLQMFGIEPSDFVDLMSKSPTKISAFINTLKEISRTYDIQNEEFFVAVLRSYQEMNENYFPDIELVADEFRKYNQLENITLLNQEFLIDYLQRKYSYAISSYNTEKNPNLSEIDLIYQEKNTIIFNQSLGETERIFLLTKEIGYQTLGLGTRPKTFPIIKVDSFEAIFNDFKANYFAGALLINKELLIGRLTYFLASPYWDSDAFNAMMKMFGTAPNTFINRVTNLLSGHFGLNNLFLLSMEHNNVTDKFNTVNEMHLRQLHSPHGYARNEHYCRRWLGLSIIKELGKNSTVCNSQISEFADSKRSYFVISVAYRSRTGQKRSDTIGFVFDKKLKSVLNFINDSKIKKRIVNQTCERCNISDCTERVAEPYVYQRKMRKQQILEAVSNYNIKALFKN